MTEWKVGDRCRVKDTQYVALMGGEIARLAKAKRLATITGLYPEHKTANVQFDKGRAKLPEHALVGQDMLEVAE